VKKTFFLVILGSDENAYGISRSYYEKYKTKPLLLCGRILPPVMHSNIVDIKVIEKFDEEKTAIKNIIEIGVNLKKEYEKLILVPCSDWYMQICIKNRKKLEAIYENCFIDETTLNSFITKDKFYNLCEKYNLKYPSTIICKKEDRNKIYNKITFKYPIVLKPNNSNSSEYLHAKFKNKKKVYILNSLNELKETINNIGSNYKDNLIIQEFVKGDDTNNIVINAYSNKHGKVTAISLGRPVLEEYHPKTIGNYAVIISSPGYNELFYKIKKFLESINYKGFSNFDLKYDEEKKEYYVFEINYRQGRSSFFVNESGLSMIDLLVDDLIYDKVTKNIKMLDKKILWLNVPISVATKYIKNKEINSEVKKLIKDKKEVHTLIYDKDMSPMRWILINKLYLSKIKQYKDYFIEK